MNMIGDSTNDDGGRALVAANPREVGVHVAAHGLILQEWIAVFCGEDNVQIDLCEGLGH